MKLRILSFIASLLTGWLFGWYLAGDLGALAGVVLGPMAWVVVDSLRASRVLDWLRTR